MPLSRRHFLRTLLPSVLLSLTTSSWAQANDESEQHKQTKETLRHFLDQLLPADQWSESASQLGVDKPLWQQAKKLPRFRQLLINGCDWLNQQSIERYSKGFSQLSAQEAHPIIDNMATLQTNQPPRRFFDNMRHNAIRLYYSDPRSWKGLNLEHPPQPLGYPEILLSQQDNKA